MAGGKETPRQKMIGMMYLVLTALLALNVSKDILQAFVVVNEGLQLTNQNFVEKNGFVYSTFNQESLKEGDRPGKATELYKKALKAKQYADEMVKYIRELRANIIAQTDGISKAEADTIQLANVNSKDNYDIPTNILIGEAVDGSKGEAAKLKKKLIEYKQNLMALIADTKDANKIKLNINTDDPKKKGLEKQTWENENFYHSPLAAVVTIFSKIENEVRNAEGDIINHLFGQIAATSFKFDKIDAKVVAQSNNVVVGSEYKADVFLAAYSTSLQPEIVYGRQVDTVSGKVIGEETRVPVEAGLGKLVVRAGSEGPQVIKGFIRIPDPMTNQIQSKYFETTFTAVRPSLTVSADKMNVLYIGVDNPVSISVPGVTNDKVKVSMSGGSLAKTSGSSYIARVTTPGEAVITVSAEIEPGKTQNMGSVKFRVKKLPSPIAKIGGKTSGRISKALLTAGGAIIPVMENFDFELFPVVTSYTVSMTIDGSYQSKQVSGNKISGDVTTLINRMRPGSKIYFEDIKVQMPDGIREIPPLSFIIQ